MTRTRYTALLPAILLITAVLPRADAAAAGSYFAVIVADVEAAVAWYEATLDLVEKSRLAADDGRFIIVNLQKPGLFVELLQLSAADPRPAGRLHGLFKAGFLVDDLDEFIAALPPDSGEHDIIVDERNELRLMQLRDPDGNAIQVMELDEQNP